MTENPKKFGKYVKSHRQDSVGIPTLTAQGRHCSSNFGKASILNEFFQSVFTKENVDDMPETAPFPLLQWGNIIVRVSGISKLLSNLNPSKASGPDQIPLYLLKISRNQSFRYHSVIQSFDISHSGNLSVFS